MKTKCPSCGSQNVLEVVCGDPDPTLVEQAGHGEVILGGCVMELDSPRWECWDCGYASQL